MARLVRRGDKIVARVEGHEGEAPQHLMLPNSCQHCENPACMVGCPTGAIGRDPGGEVFIRDALCTGCGACAKACPWDNIQMAARPLGALRPPSLGPGGSVYEDAGGQVRPLPRLRGPGLRAGLPDGIDLPPQPRRGDRRRARPLPRASARGPSGAAARAPRGRPLLVPGAALAAAGIAVAGVVMHGRGLWQPARGVGFGAVVLAAGAGMLALLGYALPKRRLAHVDAPAGPKGAEPGEGRERGAPPAPGSTWRSASCTVGLAFAHARPRPGGGAGGALPVARHATTRAGARRAAAVRGIPPPLAPNARAAALPEDLERARQELMDRLYRDASGKSDLVKRIFEKLLLPYARSPLGPLSLLASGRTLRQEEAALRARVDEVLEGRGKERLAGLAELTRVVVELRALPAQRWLLAALRVGLPVHIVSFAIAVALLGLHVVLAPWEVTALDETLVRSAPSGHGDG